jgi:hypothetical protein
VVRPQVDGAAVLGLEVLEGPAHDHGQLVGVGRLEVGEAGLAHADQRRADRLVGAALRGQRGARRGGDQEEARALVAGVDQRIEAAVDERVVERADRQQPRAEQVVGEAEGGQRGEQVVLGDAELEVLALGPLAPVGGGGHLLGCGTRRRARGG